MIKRIARRFFKKSKVDELHDLCASSPLYEDGWFRSVEEKKSIDLSGHPIPRFTYPAIEFISRRIHPELSVFEYGCGYSTRWWASRVKEVVSCEHDEDWCREVSKRVSSKVKLHHIELEYGGRYSKKVGEFNKRFDIVVIDGRDRVNCAINCIPALKDYGVIIWGNSDRAEYQDGQDFLYSKGFKKIEFVGMCPVASNKSETGIFYKQKNVLGI